MIKEIFPSKVSGILKAPASKSIAQRAIAIAALAKGKSVLHYTGNSDDVLAAKQVAISLGATLKGNNEKLIVEGKLQYPSEPLNCGESGLGFRMFSGIAGIFDQPVQVTGSGSLVTRPMDMLEKSLIAAGAHCKTHDGFLPVTIQGPMKGGEVIVDGSVSSQVLTGLLIASPFAEKDTTFVVNELKSKPYIDITLEMMRKFGVEVENQDYKTFFVKAGQTYHPTEVAVEGDWSGAAFLLVAGAIAGEVTVENLNIESNQADRDIITALDMAGAGLHISSNNISTNISELSGFEIDATDCPDLFPPLVVLAAASHGITRIKGVSRLKVKESDRATALKNEFTKLGIQVKIDGDYMEILGGKINGATIFSHNDHRIAMAGAVSGLIASGIVAVEAAEAVAKSYPGFFDDLEMISGKG